MKTNFCDLPREIIGHIGLIDKKIYYNLIQLNKKIYSACLEYTLPNIPLEHTFLIVPIKPINSLLFNDINFRLNKGNYVTIYKDYTNTNTNNYSWVKLFNVSYNFTTYKSCIKDENNCIHESSCSIPILNKTEQLLINVFVNGYKIITPLTMYMLLSKRISSCKYIKNYRENIILKFYSAIVNFRYDINEQINQDYEILKTCFHEYIKLYGLNFEAEHIIKIRKILNEISEINNKYLF